MAALLTSPIVVDAKSCEWAGHIKPSRSLKASATSFLTAVWAAIGALSGISDRRREMVEIEDGRDELITEKHSRYSQRPRARFVI